MNDIPVIMQLRAWEKNAEFFKEADSRKLRLWNLFAYYGCQTHVLERLELNIREFWDYLRTYAKHSKQHFSARSRLYFQECRLCAAAEIGFLKILLAFPQ